MVINECFFLVRNVFVIVICGKEKLNLITVTLVIFEGIGSSVFIFNWLVHSVHVFACFLLKF